MKTMQLPWQVGYAPARRSPILHPLQTGFALVEILIGLLIGMASMLVIYQLYGLSEKQRRSVSSVSSAQSVGALALFSVERDILSAGLGFAAMQPRHLGCAVQAHTQGRTPAAFSFPMVPVRITDGGKQLWVLSGSSAHMVTGSRYEASAHGVLGMEQSNAGLHAGDVALGTSDSNPAQCLLMEITAGAQSTVAGSEGNVAYPSKQVRHAQGAYRHFYTGEMAAPRRNGGAQRGMLDGGTTNLGEGALYNLGPAPQLHVWSLSKGELVYHNHLNETDTQSVAVAQDVLAFQAEYGYDADGDGRINNSNEWTNNLEANPNWARVLAVRVAVLVRSSQYERDAVTTALPRWSSGSKEFTLDGDWQHYRYRVYETVVPLRNTLWGQQAS